MHIEFQEKYQANLELKFVYALGKSWNFFEFAT